MESFSKLALTRRSIRKFKDQDIPMEDIEHCIRVAVSAPSGCNSQCWKFVAIKDKTVMYKIEAAVLEKIGKILEIKKETLTESYLTSKKKMVGFFTKAPVVIAVFMTEIEYYDSLFVSALKAQGYDDEGFMKLYSNYDILSIGAAIQNLLLAVHEMGYGACWMNEPAIAGEEINKILGIPENHRFMSLIPVGVPAYVPRDKKMKDFDEVFTAL